MYIITRQDVATYFNLLSIGLSILKDFPEPFAEIVALTDYDKIATSTCDIMRSNWKKGVPVFLSLTAKELESVCLMSSQQRYIVALEICKFLDQKITYDSSDGNGTKFSLSSMISIEDAVNNPIQIGALNTNYMKTGIWINPKFPVRDTFTIYDGKEKSKRISNRDAFDRANGFLFNCSFIDWVEDRTITNIIIVNDDIKSHASNMMRIAFAPLSDENNLIEEQYENITDNSGLQKKGIIPQLKVDVSEKISKVCQIASDESVDILFMPEMLQNKEQQGNENGYNMLLRDIYNPILINGGNVPMITVMPSCWDSGHNRALIVFQDGKIIAEKEKHTRFIDPNTHAVEALIETSPKETIIIHIPEAHRIAIEICADFLNEEEQHHIFAQLGATLVLVPSYTRGEQDFINTLSDYERFGATVIWGNCCGAIISEEKCIGACCLAGTRNVELFGSICECNHSCDGIDACLFFVDLPLKQFVTKMCPNKPIIKHIH